MVSLTCMKLRCDLELLSVFEPLFFYLILKIIEICSLQALDANTFRDAITKYLYDAAPVRALVGPIEQIAFTDYFTLHQKFNWARS